MKDTEKIREFTLSILQDISERLDKKVAPMVQPQLVQPQLMQPKPLKSLKELSGCGSDKTFASQQTVTKGTVVQPQNSSKRVITARDIVKMEADGELSCKELVLFHEDIVTPLARDLLRDKGIKLLIR